MNGRSKRLLLIALTVSVSLLYFGCSQPDDILSPVSTTRVILNSQRLPSTPDGMAYSIWAANGLELDGSGGGEYALIGSFRYDNPTRMYMDLTGTELVDGGVFLLSGDLLSYETIALSVEEIGNIGSTPGPIMLYDDVENPEDAPTEMRFPVSDSDPDPDVANLWDASVSFNMETVSDGDRNALDGYGVWFSSYMLRTGTRQDTTKLDRFTLDTIYKELLAPQDDTIIVIGIEITLGTYNAGDDTWSGETVLKPYGLDTLAQEAIRWNWITERVERKFSSVDPVTHDTTWIGYPQTDPTFFFQTGTVDTITYDQFHQTDYNLPKIPGWSYKGWVVSQLVNPTAIGEFSMPGWEPNDIHYDYMPGIDGGLISTGNFDQAEGRDFSNPFVEGGEDARIPNIPGEDFLTNLPAGLAGPLRLVPEDVGEEGSVFITLEPDNFVTDTTNFPLILLSRRIPNNTYTDSLFNEPEVIENWVMKNWSFTSDPMRGFPKVDIKMERF